jgi:hypothetical protein
MDALALVDKRTTPKKTAPGASPGTFFMREFSNVVDTARHSILIPAVFTTFSHLSESFLISAVNCSPGSVITTSC